MKKMQSWKRSSRCRGWKHAPVNPWSPSVWFLPVPSVRYGSQSHWSRLQKTQLLHSDTVQEIIDDPLHGILRRHVGKSFSIFDLADETNAPGLLCQFSLLRVKQSGFPGPAMRRVREQPSWKCLLSSTKWCNVAFHLAPLCYLSLTEL